MDVGNKLGITNIVFEALPEDKLNNINELQNSGEHVAMVGDGINDAPALSQAYLSLAMGTGSDIAMDSSDVTVMAGEIKRVADFISLGMGSMKIIKQNLFLSLVYNSLCIPLAAGLFVPIWGVQFSPVWASLAMGLSSVSVVSNSLRIRSYI